MGEFRKKKIPDETKTEEKEQPKEPSKAIAEDKGEEKPIEEPKSEAIVPSEIVLKVFMHCEGCARKVRRSLKGFPGVEDVITDTKSQKVVVKGEKVDPLKVLERIQRKSHRKVELLSPIPKPPSPPEEDKKPAPKEEKPEEKKQEIVTILLKIHMHCEACSQEIKRRIRRMKGVESAEADLKSATVSVKGAIEASKLVDYVYKRTGRQAVIIKQEPQEASKNQEEEPPLKPKEEEAQPKNKEEKPQQEQAAENNKKDEKEEKED